MTKKIVKVCGIKTVEAAQVAIENGASLIGTILVPNRARTVEPDIARQLAKLCKKSRRENGSKYVTSKELLTYLKSSETQGSEWFEEVAETISRNGPYLVGVFRNQPIDEVREISQDLGIDIIQLHGSEDVSEYVSQLDLPVIPRFVLTKPNIKDALSTHKFLIPLLDSEAGGEGKLIDWNDASLFGEERDGRYILAGGLTPDNVIEGLRINGCLGVDVSGGVETEGLKDHSKVKSFVVNAKSVQV